MSITYIGHFKSYSMAYNLKDVFFLGFEHEYPASTYGSGIEGNQPIDVSAYVDPIAKGRQRGQGLAVYKVHASIGGDAAGGVLNSADAGSGTFGLTVKPYTTSGDNSGAIGVGDLQPSSDLLIWGSHFTAPGSLVPGQGGTSNFMPFVEPSEEVPYVCVRDTIFLINEIEIALSSSDDWYVGVRMECAMITLDTATLNQLLRTQTA